MAEESEGASRTEEATPRKLEEARRKGDVAKTPDLPSWLSLCAVWGVLVISGALLARNLAQALIPYIDRPDAIPIEGESGVAVLRHAMGAGGPALVVVMAAAAAAGVFGNFVQHGFLWTTEKLKPNPKHLSPVSGLKRIFGPDGLMQFLKQTLKIACVALVCWWVLKPHAEELANIAAMTPGAILPLAMKLSGAIFMAVLAFMGVTAGADWLWQRHRFLARMRMTKEELKDDFKQSEGDPHIKARQRQLRLEKAKRRMMQAVPKATVVVMNPTHYAVALLYEPGETPAPKCVAKGLDALALRIRAVAEEAGVTVIEDPPLARALYASVDIDDVIPPAHYEAVAKVIGFVMNRAKKG